MTKVVSALALLLASFALVACGSDSDDSSTPTNGAKSQSGAAAESGAEGKSAGSGAAVSFEAASSGLVYTTDSATAKAGKVTIDFTNPQAISHDVAIEDASGQTIGKTEVITESSSSTKLELKPGDYTFYCSVPGHREAGMEGKLTVQ
jgi:plastocyanin